MASYLPTTLSSCSEYAQNLFRLKLMRKLNKLSATGPLERAAADIHGMFLRTKKLANT